MRKWWWVGLFAIAAWPQTFALSQEGEKKDGQEKKEETKEEKEAAAKKAAETRAEAMKAQRAAAQAAQKEITEIRGLISKKDLEGAEKLTNETVEAKPNWPFASTAYQMLAMAHSEAGNKEKAGEYALKFVELQTTTAKRNPAMLGNLGRMMRNVAPLLKDAGKADQVAADLEKAMDEAAKESKDRAAIIAGKVRALVALGKKDAADKAVSELDSETKKTLEGDPKVVKHVLNRLEALDVAIENFAANSEKAADLLKEKSEVVAKAIADFPKEMEIIERHVRDELSAVSVMSAEKGKEAEARLEKISELLKGVVIEGENAAKTRLLNLDRQLSSVRSRLAAARKHFELIGQSAAPIEGEFASWVNGPARSDNDLKGKVVLLDFWAVWCGPCIATFPHLIEWREKYGDKGFEIVGVTRYYQYDWDDDAKSIKREEDLEPAKEEAAMVKFAEHHKLKHSFAVQTKESKIAAFYGVTGIPQAVLIDKEGKVKLIRVGSGEKNAHDLEAAIRECLGLPAEEPAKTEKETK